MAISIRPADAADIPEMAALRAREWETEAYWTRRISAYLQWADSPRQALAERAVFVAVDGTDLVGFVAGHRTRRHGCDAELQWINVAESGRGKGIAQKLIGQMSAWFVEQGARRVCVNVEPDNLAARRLYRRCGAEPFRSHWMIWEDSRAMLAAAGESDGESSAPLQRDVDQREDFL